MAWLCSDIKREKVNDLLDSINARLSELEEEKEELKQYQDHDKKRRSLEYRIYQRELKDVGDALDSVSAHQQATHRRTDACLLRSLGLSQIEEERRRDVDNANSRREEANDRQKAVAVSHSKSLLFLATCTDKSVLPQELEETLDAHRQRLELLKIDHRETSSERRDATKLKSEVECIVQDAEDAGSESALARL